MKKEELIKEAEKFVCKRPYKLSPYPKDYYEVMADFALKAIADHEAKQWIKYPENKPEIGQRCLVTFYDGEVAVARTLSIFDNAPWDEDNVIAFRELPKPYQEEKP